MKATKKIAIAMPDINFVGGAEKVAINLGLQLSKDYDVTLVSAFAEAKSIHKLSGLKVDYLGFKRPKNVFDRFLFKLSSGLKLKKVLSDYDVVIGNNFFRYYFFPLSKIFCMEIQHLRFEEESSQRRFSHIYRDWVYRHLDKLVVLTNRDKQKFESIGLSNVTVISNAVNYEETNTDYINTIKEKCFSLAVGRLTAQKNFGDLILAWRRVLDVYPKEKLYIAGEGEQREYLEKLIDDNNLSSSIVLLGNVDDMSSLYLKAKLLISTSTYEGFPLNLIEAVSYCLPIVSYDFISGANEIIRNEYNGYLVDVGDITALSEKIIATLGNESFRNQCSLNDVSYRANFGWDKIIKDWELLLSELKK